MAKWEKVSGPDGGCGTYVDRLKVQSGWIYKVEEWGMGDLEGILENRQVVFIPSKDQKPT